MKRASSNTKAMTIRQWWDEVGTDNVLKVVDEVGSSFNYFRMYRFNLKRPRPDRAREIIAACHKHTPGFAPDFVAMLDPVKKTNPSEWNVKIQPSAAFRASQGEVQRTDNKQESFA